MRGGRSIALGSEEERDRRYYVYGKSGLESIHTNERSAVIQAESISGVVLGEDGCYVWMRGNRSIRNQIMAIKGDGITEEKNSLAVCLDTMMEFEGIVRNAKGADLFICEGMYGEPDKAQKAREYKHMTFYEAARMAKSAEVGELWLTHYSPSLTRPEEYMDEVRAIFPAAKAARDGWSAELGFDEE